MVATTYSLDIPGRFPALQTLLRVDADPSVHDVAERVLTVVLLKVFRVILVCEEVERRCKD